MGGINDGINLYAGINMDADTNVDAGINGDAGINVDAGMNVDAGINVDADITEDMLVDKDEATGTDTDSDARTGLLYIPSALPEMLSYNILFVCSSLSSFLNLVILGLIPDIGLRSLKDS